MESIGFYLGVPDMDSALDRAMKVWNAFWGPLGTKDIAKETLVDNKQIVLAMIAAVSDSLIQDKLAANEQVHHVMNFFESFRFQTLKTYQALSHMFPSHVQEVISVVQQTPNAQGDFPIDDSCLQFNWKNVPKWYLTIHHEGIPQAMLTHNDYVTMFSHVPIQMVE